jgi:SSS family solute:Na+ symporter
MHLVNWLIVFAYLAYVIHDGVRRAKGTHEIEGYFLANRSLPWWAVGLSVMATQLSAITLVGTTGQGASDGMRFIQFYFGLPIAMLVLGVTLVPLLHRAGVFTAYEFLERRFDSRTRTFTSALFLLSRGMSCGVIISAPAVIISVILGLSLPVCVAIIGLPTVIYTMIGGVQAVTWVDVKQMVVIVGGLVAMLAALLLGLPDGVRIDDALHVAGAAGRLRTFDFDFSLTETYTFWSGLIGGLFLMMAYFGTDQSQVQRYLTARSVDEARGSLLMSAYWKIPLQALVLLVGVMVFVYYLFTQPPLLFNAQHEARVRTAAPEEYAALEARYAEAFEQRRAVAEALTAARSAGDEAAAARLAEQFRAQENELNAVRGEALALAERVTGENPRDVNYIIPRFVMNELPLGLPGLFIAAVLAAAMSSIAAELNSLSTATIIDFYRRYVRTQATDSHYLLVSRLATGFWGLFACFVAVFAASLGSLIEVVNRFGSFFYGSILGVFLLALYRRATARGAFYGLIAGMSAVAAVTFLAPQVSFLWHNVIGAGTVFIVGVLLSWIAGGRAAEVEAKAVPAKG